ncbi:PLAC8 family protein [Aspergillus melleus]|uniref:PLAC8 family protein n=1 Tax=Aspergillus melleus TaxID=138277 RepID=UPI001E8EAC5A|nr:uncharacterized protein LDX57_010025 [Aspergillus melleus]KAH8432386.1 hypothetical protein LDX57_010025 [Aspergillus melleus]
MNGPLASGAAVPHAEHVRFKAACCPCFLYGKVSSRLDDPALKEYSHMNGSCCLYALTSYVGFYWILLMLKRGQMRDRFGIEGNGCKDCMAACCCPCCVLMQQDKEAEAQSEKIEKASSGAAGYQAPAGMAYASANGNF